MQKKKTENETNIALGIVISCDFFFLFEQLASQK